MRAFDDVEAEQMSHSKQMELIQFFKSQGLLNKGGYLDLGKTFQGKILMKYLTEEELNTDEEDLQDTNVSDSSSDSEDDSYEYLVKYKRGDKMETIPPAIIG